MKDTLRGNIEPGRLIRAARVRVYNTDTNGDKLPEHHYMAISSSGQPYYLITEPHLSCDCPDFEIKGEVCKHLIASLIIEMDTNIIMAISDYGLLDLFGLGNLDE